MEEEECIVISDEDDVNMPSADISVQVIDEINSNQNSRNTKKTSLPDTSIIDLTGGSEYSFISSSQPCAQTPSKPFSTSQHLIGRSPSPSILLRDTTSSPLIPDSPTHSESMDANSSPTSTQRSSSSFATHPDHASSTSGSPKKPRVKQKGLTKLDKAAREELKQQKMREKGLERARKEANRANTASKATQNCTAIVDRSILHMIHDTEEANFRTLFEESALNYMVTDESKFGNCVTWEFKRAEVEDESCIMKTNETDLILSVINGGDYVKRLILYRDEPDNPQALNNLIRDLRIKSGAMIVILVYNLNAYLKGERLKEARDYQKKFKQRFEASRDDPSGAKGNSESKSNINNVELEALRLTLQIDLEHNNPELKVHIEFREKTAEVVDSIVRYTKSTANREVMKKEKAATTLDWAINMDKERAIDPCRSREDLTRLWIAQLQQFSQITLPIAKTIAAEYPSASALIDQYQSLTHEEGQDLLAELHVQRNLKRQVGQNISRRIYKFLTSTDPDIHIGFD